MAPRAALENALIRAEWQPALFGPLNRARLASCSMEGSSASFRVRVHRNHAIEPVISAVVPFASWNGLTFAWDIGPYDDSLTFTGSGEADVELIWLDRDRLRNLSDDDFVAWLASRLHALRARTTRPIIVCAWPLPPAVRQALDRAKPTATDIVDIDALAAALGSNWLDVRAASISGTRLSNQACLHVARELACCWLPAALIAPIKCVALDLDGTLYDGVLGEDGVARIALTDGHRELHEYLVELKRTGMLLALVTRNERADVEAMFARHPDFPLALSDFAAIEASWDDKGVLLERVARQLRIGLDSMVFVDDNPGELASVAGNCEVITVHARPDGRETVEALRHVAGVHRQRTLREDSLRGVDLHASEHRDALLRTSATPDEYLRSLRAHLQFHVGSRLHVPRMAELSRKTNQFNLALSRMTEAEIDAKLLLHPANVVAVGLRDRLADSGIVALLVGGVDGDILHVSEVAVSCRALGRRLEDTMLTRALLLMTQGRAVRTVTFDVKEGPRNAPAREWLAAYAGMAAMPGTGRVSIAVATIAAKHCLTGYAESVEWPKVAA
jgi:FkbH-like protein